MTAAPASVAAGLEGEAPAAGETAVSSPTRGAWLVPVLLMAAGVALRLVHYLDRRSLWLDEAMLALNVASRSFGELLQPLDYNQTAPILFLWTERLLVVMAGVNELALRAFPMAAGILLLALLWLLARRLAGEVGALAAVTLAALSPALIRYANEAKPYGADALATVVLLLAALRARAEPGRRRVWLDLFASGGVALLVSLPSVFVIASVLAALLLDPPVRRSALGRVASCGLGWGAIAAALYAFVYRSAANNPYQQQGYEAAFLFPSLDWLAKARLAARGTVFPTFAGLGSAIPPLSDWWLAASAGLAILGLRFVWRRLGSFAAVLLVGPFLCALAASVLRCYPLGVPRLMVFGSPLLLLIAAAAAAQAVSLARARVRNTILVAAALIPALAMALARLADVRAPYKGEDAAALVAAFRDRPRKEEPIYVNARGIPSWVFYTTNWDKPNRERLAFYARAGGSGPSFENAPSRPGPVAEEGFDLVWRQRDRIEILGVATGRQWRWPSYLKPWPDEGWAANEAERIARAAEPCTWLYFTRLSERAHKPVMWELRDNYHARRLFELNVPGGVLWRYCAEMHVWAEGLARREAAKDRAELGRRND